jgi:hypothetical protein
VTGACARQYCSAVAVARVDFDGEARIVWIDDLGEGRPAAAGCLCRRHADTLRPPRHWDLRDLRRPATVDGAPTASGGESSAPAPAEPAWSPRLFASVDPGAVLDATSPLLSRAFGRG